MAAETLVKKIDAVPLRVGAEPFAAFFALLTETFRLPVSWPADRYGFLLSGGVRLGGADLGLFQPFRGLPAVEISVEPIAFDSAVTEMDRRGIAHGPLITIPVRGHEAIGLKGWREYEADKERRVPLLQLLTYNPEFYQRRESHCRRRPGGADRSGIR